MPSQRGAQDLLNNLILHGWIRTTPGGRYTLTTRTLLELRSYLEDSYPEHARKCKECDELVTIVSSGQSCRSILLG
jgi:non-structural maintenance of chromosomes element 1